MKKDVIIKSFFPPYLYTDLIFIIGGFLFIFILDKSSFYNFNINYLFLDKIENDYGIFLIIVTISYIIGSILYSLGYLLELLFFKISNKKKNNHNEEENTNRIKRLVYFNKTKIIHDYYQRIKYQRAFIRVILSLSLIDSILFFLNKNYQFHYFFLFLFIIHLIILNERYKKELKFKKSLNDYLKIKTKI
jgi:hypothetical protein